ncbi:cupin domain-containing protein [uncultured Psychroserpens sp.]|uniref:cupin domain-containing protein n=1 Tax=uncultured Psychroserpens sp. TaxID=255436 RepID=UPI002619EBFB|nr:cupin domain-containing protein [uncultured Psychroserpens sp.]
MKRQHFIKSLTGLGILSLIPQNTFARTITTFLKDLKPKIIRKNDGKLLNVIGDIQTHKLVGSDTNNQIVEWVDNVEPGVGIPPHVHTKEDEIFRVIKGQIELMIDNKITVLEAGDTAFAPKNIPHSWKVVGVEKAQMITTAFPAGIEFMFNELHKLPQGPPDFNKVAEICGKYGITFIV